MGHFFLRLVSLVRVQHTGDSRSVVFGPRKFICATAGESNVIDHMDIAHEPCENDWRR